MLDNAAWWMNPYKWVDEADYWDGDRLTIRRAVDVLTDTLVERPTDKDVMVRGIRRAVGSGKMTHRQESAVEIARQAAALGQTATTAVAAALGINRHSAWKLLSRADGRAAPPKMETSRKIFAIDDVRVSERDIQRIMATMRVDCAACGRPGCSTRYALCRSCFDTYGPAGERGERTARWLDPLISMTRATARKEAIERLHRTEWREYGAE